MQVDLHTHTTASDGQLKPEELVRQAVMNGVELLSITDHDTVAAYAELDAHTHEDFRLIAGIEFSSRWRKIGIHIVGLNVDLRHSALTEGIKIYINLII